MEEKWEETPLFLSNLTVGYIKDSLECEST